jgi:flagellar motor component MotA
MLSAFIIVVGGSFGSVALSFGLNQLKNFPKLFMQAFFSPKSTIPKTIDYIIMLAENARKEGLLSLEKIILTPAESDNAKDKKKDNKSKKDSIDPLLNREFNGYRRHGFRADKRCART